MRKLIALIGAFAVVFTFSASAMALEHEFGGYWRVRMYKQENFTGEDKTEARNVSQTDTRTRIYYIAKINDNLKLVNKFEMDAIFGDNPEKNTYGDVGADSVSVEVKNTYADFNLGDFNFKIGVQGAKLARGFLFKDDFAGAVITYKSDAVKVPFIWIKPYEGSSSGGKDKDEEDVDYYALAPSFKLGKSIKLTPYVMHATSDDASSWGKTAAFEDLSITWVGADLDAKLGGAKIWLTAISESGDAQDVATKDNYDIGASLAAAGISFGFGPVDIHGQIFHATGDSNGADKDLEAFWVPADQDYGWSEIMGNGIFDNQASSNSPADVISDITAYNVGISFKPADKMKLAIDLWQANLAENDASNEDDLGTEFDVKLTYKLLDNLKLEVVGAYLNTGNATYKGPNQANATEIGTRLSLKF